MSINVFPSKGTGNTDSLDRIITLHFVRNHNFHSGPTEMITSGNWWWICQIQKTRSKIGNYVWTFASNSADFKHEDISLFVKNSLYPFVHDVCIHLHVELQSEIWLQVITQNTHQYYEPKLSNYYWITQDGHGYQMLTSSLSAFTWHSRKPNYWVSQTMIGSLRCMYTP